jgi:hypothetical protein
MSDTTTTYELHVTAARTSRGGAARTGVVTVTTAGIDVTPALGGDALLRLREGVEHATGGRVLSARVVDFRAAAGEGEVTR